MKQTRNHGNYQFVTFSHIQKLKITQNTVSKQRPAFSRVTHTMHTTSEFAHSCKQSVNHTPLDIHHILDLFKKPPQHRSDSRSECVCDTCMHLRTVVSKTAQLCCSVALEVKPRLWATRQYGFGSHRNCISSWFASDLQRRRQRATPLFHNGHVNSHCSVLCMQFRHSLPNCTHFKRMNCMWQ